MKKKIILIVTLLVLSITVCKASSDFSFNTDELFASSKNGDVKRNFNQDYNITYAVSNKNEELEKEIRALAKKTTFLLFGDFNNTNESSEHFYKRSNDYYNLRYQPTVPKKSDGKEDENSTEGVEKSLSSWALSGVFPQAVELGLIYNSFGDIRISVIDDNYVICSVALPNVKIKTESEDNPMDYVYKKTNYVMYYYFKKANNEWQLYYLYGEDADDLAEYFNEVEESKSGTMSLAPSYDSDLSKIYKFDKLKKVTENEIKKIYSDNVNSIVTLKSVYNNYIVNSAKGFYISDNLILTTWNFLEKSLVEAQYITVNGKDFIEIEGIVTINPENDLAILKVKNNGNKVNLGDYKKINVEDPTFVINNEIGGGSAVQSGIVISNSGLIQTSIPMSSSDGGSPVFNQNGEVIGMITSKSLNSSISVAISSEALYEIQNKFKSINNIETISFEKLKEKYYYVNYNSEKVINDISESKWNKYSKIGDIENTIKLELIKANYSDGIVSLRYKNGISEYISSMQLAVGFREKLIQDGYKEITNTSAKCIYRNDDYQVIIMDEFDYLIVVMVKL